MDLFACIFSTLSRLDLLQIHMSDSAGVSSCTQLGIFLLEGRPENAASCSFQLCP
jgi:hypothetical protein